MLNFPDSSIQEIRKSLAYQRMKVANPGLFEPKTIYFATYAHPKDTIDWQNCFHLKASIVYEAITGEPVINMKTRERAEELLKAIAKECKSLVELQYRTSQPEKPQESNDLVREGGKEEKIDPAALQSKSKSQEKEVEKGTSDQTRPPVEDYIDGIFLVVGFLLELKKITDTFNREEADSRYLTTYREEMVKDIIKIENQLSLKLIEDIADKVEEAVKKQEGKFGGKVEEAVKKQEGGKVEAAVKKEEGKFGRYSTGFKGDFEGIINRFCWYYSPFHSSTVSKQITKEAIKKEKLVNLLQCLHFSLKSGETGEVGSGQARRSPSARQLKRSGVRFEASPKAIIDVRFVDQQNKLEMPALVYDFKLETVVRNLHAWECLPTEKYGKPVTRFFQFMNELVGDLGDVRVMKKFGIIKGTWKNLQEVLDLVKRTDGPASYPSVYTALDEEVRKVRENHDTRMKRFFVRNRPAVLWFSSVAAASVIATAAIYAARRRGGGVRPS